MRRTAVLLAAVCVLPAVAQKKKPPLVVPLKRCAAIQGDRERLDCFDKLTKARGIPGPRGKNVKVTGKGRWRVNVKTNPMDDSTTATAILPQDGKARDFRGPVTLILRCMKGEYSAYIAWNDYLGSEAIVTSRMDKLEAKTERWDMSTDSKATFYPRNAERFVGELVEAKHFVAQVTPYNESPKTAVFTLRGLENAVKPLRKACPPEPEEVLTAATSVAGLPEEKWYVIEHGSPQGPFTLSTLVLAALEGRFDRSLNVANIDVPQGDLTLGVLLDRIAADKAPPDR